MRQPNHIAKNTDLTRLIKRGKITRILMTQKTIRTSNAPRTREKIGIVRRKIVISRKRSFAMIISTACRSSPNARLLAISSARVRTPRSNSPASTSVSINAWLVSALNQTVTSPTTQTDTNLRRRVISEEWELKTSCRVTSTLWMLANQIKSYGHT